MHRDVQLLIHKQKVVYIVIVFIPIFMMDNTPFCHRIASLPLPNQMVFVTVSSAIPFPFVPVWSNNQRIVSVSHFFYLFLRPGFEIPCPEKAAFDVANVSSLGCVVPTFAFQMLGHDKSRLLQLRVLRCL